MTRSVLWRGRRAGCSHAHTWALATLSLVTAVILLLVALTVLLVLMARALEDLD